MAKETALTLLDEMIDPLELAAELAMDEYHPANDRYQSSIRSVQRMVNTTSRKLGKYANIARYLVQGLNHTEIAAKLNVHPTTVSKHAKRPEMAELVNLIHHLNHARDGATADHRKGFLWRIAVDNEEVKPNISIQAIQEINKMSGAYQIDEAKNVINIQINNEAFPRGALDVDIDHNVGK